MKNLFIFALVLSLSSAPFAFAEDGQAASSATNGNKDESWYFNFGFGGAANPNYGSTINGQIDNLKTLTTDFKRRAATAEIGFYWPLESKNIALGVSLFGVNDHIEASSYSLDITQSVLAFSTLWYPTSNIGDGLFLRGDIGPARYSSTLRAPSGSSLTNSRSDAGGAIQLGLGYSLPVSSETRLALGLFFSRTKVSEISADNASIQLSCML